MQRDDKEGPVEQRAAFVRAALEAHERGLILFARGLVGDLDRARDVVQECFLRLCKVERGEVEAHLAEWLYRVCRNLALDVLRKESRMGTPGDENVVSRAGTAPPSSEESERRDEAGRALRVLDSLPEKQREVLRLKFQQELSYKEIAHVAEISIGHVGWLIHMGMKSLRARLVVDGAEGAEA